MPRLVGDARSADAGALLKAVQAWGAGPRVARLESEQSGDTLMIAIIGRDADVVGALKKSTVDLAAELVNRFSVAFRLRVFAPSAADTVEFFLGRRRAGESHGA